MKPRHVLFRATFVALVVTLSAIGEQWLHSRVLADSQGASHLHIDADPTNGSGPCNPIDTTTSVLPSDPVAVAICLEEADIAPLGGGFTSATLRVNYAGAGFSASNVTGNGTTDLDANPDWNEAGLGGAGVWDCNQLNISNSAPKASPSPADITCATNNVQNQAVPATAYLALLTFAPAPASGALTLTFSSETSILSGFFEGFCGGDLACTGATVSVLGPESPTPTPTHTPTPTATFTATPTSTFTPTPTPTPTSSPTATATRVPGACDGDVNLDGFVDALDLVLVGRRLHAFAPDPRFDTQPDINGDAAITALDLRIVIQDIRTGECS
jgi:hypothetical protein